MRTSPASAVFIGTARDCARWLPDVLDNLSRLARLYDRVAFVFAVSAPGSGHDTSTSDFT